MRNREERSKHKIKSRQSFAPYFVRSDSFLYELDGMIALSAQRALKHNEIIFTISFYFATSPTVSKIFIFCSFSRRINVLTVARLCHVWNEDLTFFA